MSTPTNQPTKPTEGKKGKPSPPPLTPEARTQANRVGDDFAASLKAVAEEIAKHQKAEAVLVPHVNEALLTLKRSGMRKPPDHFWQRPDFKVGFGTFVFSLGPTLASFAKDVLEVSGPLKDQPGAMWAFMICPPFLLCIAGCFIAARGWTQSYEQ